MVRNRGLNDDECICALCNTAEADVNLAPPLLDLKSDLRCCFGYLIFSLCVALILDQISWGSLIWRVAVALVPYAGAMIHASCGDLNQI